MSGIKSRVLDEHVQNGLASKDGSFDEGKSGEGCDGNAAGDLVCIQKRAMLRETIG